MTVTIKHCQILAFQPGRIDIPALPSLLSFAKRIGVLVEICDQEFVDQKVLDGITQKLGKPSVNASLNVMLICGAFLEEQVSLAAHHMLATGYAVHLLREMVMSKTPEHAMIHDLRLVQSGVVPTTLRQMIYEWMSSESDENVRSDLKQMLFQ